MVFFTEAGRTPPLGIVALDLCLYATWLVFRGHYISLDLNFSFGRSANLCKRDTEKERPIIKLPYRVKERGIFLYFCPFAYCFGGESTCN